ncbi:MAG: TIGR00303 family protein [Methanocorpusculum sp.]|uniref:nicotinate mononucleotide-dependent phosphoribosyltransferase CobT n=1 Tax=Methanocorpusculum sp. TaxID=2058474 RepID=UPI00271C94B6|nr:TIGR00303 family protein [Methanocorpusculum sp.]MDO9523347.1 TIGR00303 family protein [Methanocorpusculum sp.]
MSFVSTRADFPAESPMFALILSNSLVSTIEGVSGAGESPAKSLMVPPLDAELIINGEITSVDMTPNTPTGCPTPAVMTLAMMDLIGMKPLMIAAGLDHEVTVPHMQFGEKAGGDPRNGQAVPNAKGLFEKGRWLGEYLSQTHDLLVLGECLPGGTTTALCVLRALGYQAKVSSCLVDNPVCIKERIASEAVEKVHKAGVTDPLGIVSMIGDPMIPVAAGIAEGYRGKLFLAGGTQMLAAAAVIRALGNTVPDIVTTIYVYNDKTASFKETAAAVGADAYYVDPEFDSIGHAGLARYAEGEIKEGSGAGGAMFLASILGFAPEDIKNSIREQVIRYT